MQIVSVIIPNFNNSRWLSKCIDSCLLQEGHFNLEIIVVDDFSTDNSWELLSNYKSKHPNKIKIFKNINKGGNNARNYGFSQSTGHYIQWLDSDDIILPNKINKQVEFFKKNPDTDIVYSDWQMDFYEENEFIRTEVVIKESYHDFTKEILLNNWNPPNAYLLKRSIVDKTIKSDGWNVNTRVGQDREFYTKSALLGAKFNYCKGNFAIYNRWSSNTVSHVSHKENIIQASLLNQIFHNLLLEQVNFKNEAIKTYCSILNTELVRSLFYHPKLKLPRKINIYNVNWSEIHWKIRPLVFCNLLLFK